MATGGTGGLERTTGWATGGTAQAYRLGGHLQTVKHEQPATGASAETGEILEHLQSLGAARLPRCRTDDRKLRRWRCLGEDTLQAGGVWGLEQSDLPLQSPHTGVRQRYAATQTLSVQHITRIEVVEAVDNDIRLSWVKLPRPPGGSPAWAYARAASRRSTSS